MANINNSNISISDEVYLENYNEFVKIDNVYYGGNQTWLSLENHISIFQSDRSCGVIAATNTFLYMIRDNKSINISKKSFLEQALDIYKYITPRFYGIPTISTMARGLKGYYRSINLEIKTSQLINPSKTLETIQFIKKALANNSPILMITWNTKIPNLKNHWVTITGYYRTTLGEHFVVTSNWGRKEVFSLDNWIKDKSLYKGMLYYSVCDKSLN